MEKSSKNLKEKVLFLMCLGALAGNISTEVYAQENPKNYKDLIEKKFNDKEYNKDENGKITITYLEKEKITDKISMGVLWKGTEDNPININLLFNNTVEINDSGIEIENANVSNPIYEDITMQFSENLSIYNKNGYAIYGKSYASGTAGIASIIIGNQDNKKNIVKIIGNIKAESKNGSGKSEIKLNLNNEYSFFAGKMETGENNKDNNNEYNNSIIEMNLKDKATWYAHRSNVDDIYTIDGSNKEIRTEITSNGGIIDIYNSAPNEVRTESAGTREFKLKGVGDRLQKTTFCISTDITNKKSDLIKLEGVDTTSGSQTYYVQIVADPIKGEWKLEPGDKIPVMDITGTGLDNITVKGKEYTKETGAGLVEQTITPTIKEDKKGTGDWYLTGIEKVENKGSGHIFAEIGAAANAGMASAWRTDSGDLYQRMGNLRNNEAEQGVWGRIYTGENEIRKGIDLDLEYRAVQVGYDRKENIDGGKLFTGIAFGYFDGNADYDHGSGESNSATVGMYATYSGNNGSFGDFIVKLGNIDNKLSYISESGDYYKADYDTYGFSADAEYGYRYEFSNDYYIEPLAQLSYIYIADEEYTMNLNGESGAKVSNDDYQSLIGYAGFHYGKKFGDNVAYLRVAAAHEFAGDIDVDARYQDIKVNSSISGEDTWVEYGVGFDVKVKEDTAVYGRLQKSTGDIVKNKWHASVGIRYTF